MLYLFKKFLSLISKEVQETQMDFFSLTVALDSQFLCKTN